MSANRGTRGGLILTLLLVGLGAQPAMADGWPQKKGGHYFSLRFSTFQASQYFEPNGNRIDIPTVGAYAVSLYGEYGITDRITVVGTVPFERITLNEQVGRTTGVLINEGAAINAPADATLGLRVGLWRGSSTVLSGAVSVGIPIGNDTQENGLYTGDGEFNQTVALELGHSLWPRDAYATASVGFNQRSSGYSDEMVFAVQAGHGVTRSFALDVRLSGVASLMNGDAESTGLGFRGNDQRYFRYGLTARYAATSAVDLNLGVERAARRRNMLSGTMFSLGVALKG